LFLADGSTKFRGHGLELYAKLRLKGEFLLAAEVGPAEVEPIVRRLQLSGSPAVFVLRKGAPDLPPDLACRDREKSVGLPGTSPVGPEDFAQRSAARRSAPHQLNKSVFASLRENEQALEVARQDLVDAARLGHALTAAAEWMLDNAHLVRTEISLIRRHLPRNNRELLPILAPGYDLAQELVAHTDNAISEANILNSLREYQTVALLSTAELWFFPLLLRIALIEALKCLASRVNRAQQLREAAYLWANRLAAAVRRGTKEFEQMLGQMAAEPVALQPCFLTSVVEQLQDEESALAPLQRWIEDRLNTSITDIVRSEHTREAAERISTANAFGSLRVLSQMKFTEIFEAVSKVEAELRADPIYANSDFATRDQCRRVVERISRNSALNEFEVAKKVTDLAAHATDPQRRHAAYYLLADGVTQLEADIHSKVPFRLRVTRLLRRRATFAYLTSISGLAASFMTLAVAIAWEAGVHDRATLAVLGALSFFPLSELAIQIVNALAISLLPPEPLPKMDFKNGIPPELATLVVVPMMLSSLKVARQEIEKLEVRFLANREPNLFYSLFSDFTDCAEATSPGDEEVLREVREGIAGLNKRYEGERFLLFHRPRVWSECEGKWIGRERKRGKIEDLNAFLCGAGSPEICSVGKLPLPVQYVITLDADTQLPPLSARRMVETIAHPLNRVEIDPVTRTRRRGFTIIQPRVSIALPGATATRFTRVFADTSGTDPYSQTVSDAQQDLFGEAIFHGKAIYDVPAFRATVGDRFPAETLLSHDLIEGAHAGVGLASDIELFENLPLDYVSFSKRQQRWIRGDWQILQWLFARVPLARPEGGNSSERNPLTIMNRWRILDNLRRSLVPVASLMLLLFGWLISAAPGIWTLVVGVAIATPALAPLLDRLARFIQGTVQGWRGAFDELRRALVMIAFLPHQAWLSVDAIARVAYRRKISHRRLLEWQTAEITGATAHRHLSSTMRQMLTISSLSALLMIVLLVKGDFAPTSVFLALWLVSPLVLRWLGRPAPLPAQREIDRPDTVFLRRLARRTWRYFDDLVNAETNWLPPDNSQVALRIEVAQRTSPTNIGLWLASALAATDMGYLTVDDFLERCTATMATLDRLERYDGHFLNWYETRTLQPLPPRYVSTVDSGNLLASFWVLEQGCEEVLHAPLLNAKALSGMGDALGILREVYGRDRSIATPIQAMRRLFHSRVEGHELVSRLRLAQSPMQQLRDTRRWKDPADEGSYWIARLERELSAWTNSADRYLKWMETLANPSDSILGVLGQDVVKLRRRALHAAPSLSALAEGGQPAVEAILARRGDAALRPDISAWLDQLAQEYAAARANAAEAVKRARELGGRAGKFAGETRMGLVYDSARRLFGVGYAVGGPLEFNSHYDLLASECRLASLVAIAKGDVPIQHWYALGRPLASSSSGQTLLSWSGTMFEYLMPLLFTRVFDNSLLNHACHQAVKLQMEYGSQRKVPWGVSESAYSALDANQIYQYRAFGVPTLALKPGLEDELVVAPYATMLALLIEPEDAIENLKRLRELDLVGPMGFYESIDFSLESKRDGELGVAIYAYMAHHQGMSLIALDNVLNRDVMQHRFHGDLRIRAVESLLFERIPITRFPQEAIQTRVAPARPPVNEEPAERTWKEDTALPRVHLYGNGAYALMVTNSGGGYSRWNDFDLTRWRSDTTLDSWGSFLYIRDRRTDSVWTAGSKPLGGRLATMSVSFSADRAEYHRELHDIETAMDVTVASEDDVELRRVAIANHSLRTRQLEFTSYLELSLSPHRADTAHPAFAKMFIETEYPGNGVLIARRRPRSPEEPPIWAAHVLIGAHGPIQYETDRAVFLGRANTVLADALRKDLSGSVGAVLDPIFSLRCRLTLEPRERVELSFLTIAAASREALLALVDKYQRSGAVTRAFEMAWTRAQLEFRYLGIGPAAAHRYHELASHLLYPSSRLRPTAEKLARNHLGQSVLWAYGISGDLPMAAVVVADQRGIPLVREMLLAHTAWRLRGFRVDLIILNQESPSYDRPLRQQLMRQIEAHSAEAGIDRPGGAFLRDWYAMPEDHRNLLLATSSVVLNGSRGSLPQQLAAGGESLAPLPFIPVPGGSEVPSAPLPFLELPYFNGLGGFTQDGREYAIYLKPGSPTPTPWANVMANSGFGAMVTESGLGCTWRGNSQANRITPWHNDPVNDPQSEVIYLRDEETGTIWTPTALPIREQDAYRAKHGQGYTVFEHNSHAIGQELTVFVPPGDNPAGEPVKIYRLRLRNDSGRSRRLAVTYFAEWLLGSSREEQQLHVHTSHDEASGALVATQYRSGAYAGQVAFAASSPRAASYSADRTQFLGRNGSVSKPAGMERNRLDNRTGAGLDPAAVLQVPVTIQAGQQVEVSFFLGQETTIEAARALLSRYQDPGLVESALESTRRWWDTRLTALQVHTPVLSTDFLLNRWLPYQTLSCRFWGRTALYQSSGAFGFRDQLQDSMALLYAAPELTRGHILLAAERQFAEGDVQHWWHPETGLGVRTRCSDDMLWLPFVVAQYLEITGDTAILDEQRPFLDGAVLKDGEQESVFVPTRSSQTASLWEHCRRALDHAVTRLGAHGLPLIGAGDWNDGMNRVGIEGRGESGWLAWFLCDVIESFSRITEKRASGEMLAAAWRGKALDIAMAMETSCWDGEWYLRGFFDNGTPLGSRVNTEARIDSLPQSWAVISGVGDAARARRAMESADRLLVKERERLVLLFTPPFDRSEPHPGYIMGYPAGVRENGGQYTHGSLWLAAAWARLGEGDKAVRLLKTMDPVEYSRDTEAAAKYRGEPYVVAADVSAAPKREGRCGWTWYTGSAGWMYRIWIEDVLGFRLRGDKLTVKPAIPDTWAGFEMTYRHHSATYEVAVRRRTSNEATALELDGHLAADGFVLMKDDGAVHKVTVWIARQAQASGSIAAA
jgi:cellobiose phosphorylase